LNDRELFFDFSTRVKLRVGGEDRLRFLNGQVSADARKATTSNAMEACLLDAKGKMTAHVFLFSSADSFFMDADPELKDAVEPRLERYIIADDVLVEDVSDRLSIFHVISEVAPALPAAKWIAASRRFVRSGWDIWIAASEHNTTLQQLSATFRPRTDERYIAN